jgi:hypothetical protein
LIGFKLKGFRWFFEHKLQAHLALNQGAFLRLASAIEAVCQRLGDELIADDRRSNAYRAARKIAEEDDAQLFEFPKAA